MALICARCDSDMLRRIGRLAGVDYAADSAYLFVFDSASALARVLCGSGDESARMRTLVSQRDAFLALTVHYAWHATVAATSAGCAILALCVASADNTGANIVAVGAFSLK